MCIYVCVHTHMRAYPWDSGGKEVGTLVVGIVLEQCVHEIIIITDPQ